MELAYYEVTFRQTPHSAYSTSAVYCHGEFEAFSEIKRRYPEAVIIKVKKR